MTTHEHEHNHSEGDHEHLQGGACHNPAADQLPADQVADCPVMPGNLVIKAEAAAAGLVRDYHGVRYYLCCSGCGPKFDADPAAYAHAA